MDVASQRSDPASLRSLYSSLIALRHARTSVAEGDAVRAAVTGGSSSALALLRTSGSQRTLFLANFGTAPIGPILVDVSGTPHTLLAEGLSSPAVATGGKLSVPGLAARSFAFIELN